MANLRRWGLPVWVLCLSVTALACGAARAADEPPPPDAKAVDAVIHRALRDVINEGADMYNAQGRYQNGERDYAGCYHLYEGALLGLRPLLAAHPDLQKDIDAGLDNARNTPRVEMRAFVLREVIDKIRDATGGKPVAPPTEQTLKGKVTRAAKEELDVKSEDGEKAWTVKVPDTAVVMIDGKKGYVEDIKKDSTVTVTHKDFVASKIEAKAPTPLPPPPPAEKTFTGKVIRADKDGLLLRDDAGKDKPFPVPDTAKVTIDGKDGKLDDIKKDSTATVTSKGDEVIKVEAKSPTNPPPKETLWDRLGGEAGVAKVVDDFVNTAGKDPKVNFWRDPTFTPSKEQIAEVKKQLVAFVSKAAGGPLKYEGKDMKEAHKGMKITDDEFNAAAAHLKAALEKNGVKADDVKAVLGAVEGTRKDIVEAKAPEDKPKPEDKPAEKGDVSGKVTFKGQPLPGGTVSFVAADGKIYSSPIAADGTYNVTDVKVGEYKVAIETESAKPKDKPNPPEEKKPDDKGAAAFVAIPKKYAKPETTDLVATVMKGKQTKDFDLSP
jgi:hemoglobin